MSENPESRPPIWVNDLNAKSDAIFMFPWISGAKIFQKHVDVIAGIINVNWQDPTTRKKVAFMRSAGKQTWITTVTCLGLVYRDSNRSVYCILSHIY